eukprot:445229_1
MAQQSNSKLLDDEVLSLLKVNGRGWDIGLFEDENKASSFLCEDCHSICCDAVELGCDHDDADICSFCKECLEDLVKKNSGKCPINQHDHPMISSSRFVRRQILKSQTMCPHSAKYKEKKRNNKNNNNNGQLIDTSGGDEKEGMTAKSVVNNVNISGCDWNGSFNDLLNGHLSECTKISKPAMTQNIMIKKLNKIIDEKTKKNESQKERINALNSEINELKKK